MHAFNVCVWKRVSCVLGLLAMGCGAQAPPVPAVNPYSTSPSSPSAPQTAQTATPSTPRSDPFGSRDLRVSAKNPSGTPADPSSTQEAAAKQGAPEPTNLTASPKRQPSATDTSSQSESDRPAAQPQIQKGMAPPPASPKTSKSQVAQAGSKQKSLPSESPETQTAPTHAAPDQIQESAVAWSIEADPAPQGCFLANTAEVNLKMPPLGSIGPDFVESTRLRVLFPTIPGTSVALGLNDDKKQYREIWRLSDKKKLGQIRNWELGNSRAQALSPDGMYLAAKPQWDSSIVVYSLSQSKTLPPIKLEGQACPLIAFAGKDRLIFQDQQTLRVWSVTQMQEVHALALGSWKPEDGWALSPGGRYLAMSHHRGKAAGIRIADLQSGQIKAAINLSADVEPNALAFTQDGRHLAALLGSGPDEFRQWSVTSGQVTLKHNVIEMSSELKPRENYQGGRLEWFPNHRHLLIGGRAVFDSREGKIIKSLESPPIYPVRVIGQNQLGVAVQGELTTQSLKAEFDAVADEQTNVSGTAARENMPEIAPVDRSKIVAVELADVEWSVRLGRPPEPLRTVARGVEIPMGEVFIGRLAQTGAGLGYVMYTNQPIEVTPEGIPQVLDSTRAWLEPIDLLKGTRQKQIPFPHFTLLLSINQDGTLACTQNADGLNRLEIWSMRDGSLKEKLIPYGELEPGLPQQVTYAEFVDPFHLLTVAAGRMTLWDILNRTAVYEVEIGESRPELSPARDYVALVDQAQRNTYFVESKSGRVAGSIATSESDGSESTAFAFGVEGRFFASIASRIDGGDLRIFDLDTGELKKKIPLPLSGKILQWMGADYLLLNGTQLISTSRECIVWSYILSDGMHLRDSPDHRHWYIAADPSRSNNYKVLGVNLPDEVALARIGVASLRGRTLLEPGKSIGLDVELSDPEGTTGFAEQIREVLTDRYHAARIRVATGDGVTLRVRDLGDQSGWSMALIHGGKSLWTRDISNEDGPDALMGFEPPLYAFPAGAEQGAGQSELSVRGTQ